MDHIRILQWWWWWWWWSIAASITVFLEQSGSPWVISWGHGKKSHGWWDWQDSSLPPSSLLLYSPCSPSGFCQSAQSACHMFVTTTSIPVNKITSWLEGNLLECKVSLLQGGAAWVGSIFSLLGVNIWNQKTSDPDQQILSCLSTGNANCVEYLLEQKYVRSMEGNLFSPVHCSV
jgi:hypothetical protein